jgi:quinolinate synthase
MQVPADAAAAPPLPERATRVLSEFAAAVEPRARYELLLSYAARLPSYPEELRTVEHRVMGCTAQAWVDATLDNAGRVQLRAASDSALTSGIAGVLVESLSGLTPAEVLSIEPAALLGGLGLGPAVLAPSRAQGAGNMLEAIKRRTRRLTVELPRFPSLLISSDGVSPQGGFAEAQAQFLQPNQEQVLQLATMLREQRVGVVAHFYMDPQVCCCYCVVLCLPLCTALHCTSLLHHSLTRKQQRCACS